MGEKGSLDEYRRKRDFEASPEPEGATGNIPKFPRFVIQKHAATRLHYDFRLEIDGVLKSWAVPKGPSLDPTVKRLAMPTEDHPLDYLAFEGIIPKGNYGAGRVIVWDMGVYQNMSELSIEDSVKKGHIHVWLQGTKISGGFALQRIREEGSGRGDGRETWLLIKVNDDTADPDKDPVSAEPQSAISGKTLEQLE